MRWRTWSKAGRMWRQMAGVHHRESYWNDDQAGRLSLKCKVRSAVRSEVDRAQLAAPKGPQGMKPTPR